MKFVPSWSVAVRRSVTTYRQSLIVSLLALLSILLVVPVSNTVAATQINGTNLPFNVTLPSSLNATLPLNITLPPHNFTFNSNRSIIVFKDRPETAILKKYGIDLLSLVDMYFAVGQFPPEILAKLKSLGIVDYVEKDKRIRKSDVKVSTQSSLTNWALGRVSQHDLPLGDRYTYPASAGSGVNVYVLDTGINIDHPEFQGRAVAGQSFAGGSSGTDVDGHGTFVASQIGGTKAGVAKNVSLISVQVLDSSGEGSSSIALNALQWVYNQHRDSDNKKTIINMSLGGDRDTSTNKAISKLASAGITVVAAAGNGDDNGDPFDACQASPASAPDAITVGATDRLDQYASFSNYGKCVTLSAPGVQLTGASTGGGFRVGSGTSFSAPLVSGAAALILGEAGTVAPKEMKRRLIDAATKNDIGGFIDSQTPNRLLYTAADFSPDTSDAVSLILSATNFFTAQLVTVMVTTVALTLSHF